jgi:hypothetical protein
MPAVPVLRCNVIVAREASLAFFPQMKPNQAAAFQGAAKQFNVFILVRRTNLMSLNYVGDPGFVPKRLDCKAKTADTDYTDPKYGLKQTAGLVVDPTITGSGAFKTSRKFASAMKEWAGFESMMLVPAVRTFERQKALTCIPVDSKVPNGRFYFVDLDPASPRYGCVKFTASSLLSAGKYIHGDFDLYGIIRADDPSRNVAVEEKRLDQKHSRSPEFFDVQHYVNSRIGAPMVLHGAQESYGDEHSDEGIDIFHPDGKMTGAENAMEIAALYEKTFKGRKLFTKGGEREVVRGLFKAPA